VSGFLNRNSCKICIFPFRKKLTSKVGYTPSDYLDPALRTKWNTLEGMALGRENIESVEDLVMPDLDAIDNVRQILSTLIITE
jgi:hypothetical protein